MRFVLWFVSVVLLGIAVVPTPCQGEDAEKALKGKLLLTGSSTVAPVAREIAVRFEKLHPGVHIEVKTGGSSRGIEDARSGKADIGMASRDLNAKEKDLHAHPIARDGICLIVHKKNPIAKLTREQVIAVYTGKTTNWKDLGGADSKIVVVNKAEGRATLELFLHFFKLKSKQVKSQVSVGDNEEGIKAVSERTNAIGYVSIGAAAREAASGVPIKLLPFAGVESTLENVRDEKYPISRSLLLVTKEEPKGLAKAFIDYARSDKVHDLVKKLSFVPLAKK